MTLSECPTRSNNLHLIRFLAAILVIISHSFMISTGDNKNEWFLALTNDQISMGGFAVSIFFCAGGYLIAKSVERANNGFSYFRARIFRIFPSLVAVVFVTTLVLGPIVTEYRLVEYFSDRGTYKYLLNGILVLQHDLPGVFVNNPSDSTVNGALWTLPVEFLCYIACFVIWKTKFMQKKLFKWTIPAVIVGTIGLNMILQYIRIEVLFAAIRPSLLFYMGIFFYVYRDKIRFTKWGVLISALLLVLSSVFGILDAGMVLCFPYLLLYVSFVLPQVSEKYGKTGNISYGIYLWGLPVQQTLVMISGGSMSPYLNMVLAIPLAIFLGYLTYRFVELPIIGLERKYIKKSTN